jgi:predicted ATPase
MTLALACWSMSYVHLCRREPAEAQAWAEREIAICEEHQLPLRLFQGAFQLGRALVERGEPEAGIARMRQGLAGVGTTGFEIWLPYFVALLGEAHAEAGRPEEGLAEVERALAMAEGSGAGFQVPEMLRLKGELLLRRPAPDRAAAEACFRGAVAAARAQGARLPELRALTSLARLPRGGAEGAAARDALASAYGWFTEGFDTLDLREARALLEG